MTGTLTPTKYVQTAVTALWEVKNFTLINRSHYGWYAFYSSHWGGHWAVTGSHWAGASLAPVSIALHTQIHLHEGLAQRLACAPLHRPAFGPGNVCSAATPESVAQPRRRLRAEHPRREQRPAVAAALAAGAATAGVAASTAALAETSANLAVDGIAALPIEWRVSELGMQISIRGKCTSALGRASTVSEKRMYDLGCRRIQLDPISTFPRI